MIYETLTILKDEFSKYLELKTAESNLVVLENIAKRDDSNIETIDDKVVLTLLNIGEEQTLKTNPNIKLNSGATIYKNPTISLQIFALFSANRISYNKSLEALSYILEFFQLNKIFTRTTTSSNSSFSVLENSTEFRIVVNLYTPNFEQTNNIWGTLGGKCLPSLIYKISVVGIENDGLIEKGKPITEI